MQKDQERNALGSWRTFLIEYDRHIHTCPDTGESISPPVAVLDCAALFDITIEPEKGVIFGFTLHVSEDEWAEIHAAFERDEYDYLGNTPEW